MIGGAKRKKKQRNASRTPGKQKTLACQATQLERFFAKRSRSYKHAGYWEWASCYLAGNTKIRVIK